MIRLEGKRYARRLALLRSRAIAAAHRRDPIPVVRVKLDSPPAPPRKPSLLARLFGRRGK